MALALWPINSNGNWNKPRSSSNIRLLRLLKSPKKNEISVHFILRWFLFFFLFAHLFVKHFVNFSEMLIVIRARTKKKSFEILISFDARGRKKGGVNDKIFGFALSPATETWHRSLQWLPNSVQRHEKPVCHVPRSLDNINSVLLLETYRLKGNRVSRRYYAPDNKTSFLFPSRDPWFSLSFRNHQLRAAINPWKKKKKGKRCRVIENAWTIPSPFRGNFDDERNVRTDSIRREMFMRPNDDTYQTPSNAYFPPLLSNIF